VVLDRRILRRYGPMMDNRKRKTAMQLTRARLRTSSTFVRHTNGACEAKYPLGPFSKTYLHRIFLNTKCCQLHCLPRIS
jgi:hypothetical protein